MSLYHDTFRKKQEWLDIVDDNARVIDRMLRSDVYEKKLLFRAVCGFIKNAQGELWIPRRTAHKMIFPLCFDMSIAGHVDSGETYEEAFARELDEELNLKVHEIAVRDLGYVKPSQGFVCFTKVYEIAMDEVPRYNPDDFCEYFWLTPDALVKKLEAGEPAKSDLIKHISYFYLPSGARSSVG